MVHGALELCIRRLCKISSTKKINMILHIWKQPKNWSEIREQTSRSREKMKRGRVRKHKKEGRNNQNIIFAYVEKLMVKPIHLYN